MATRRPVVEILDPMVVEILRKKTPAERLRMAFDMWDMACIAVRSAIRQIHPEWEEDQVLREAARRLSHGATESVPR